MAFKKMNVEKNFLKWKDCAEGDVIAFGVFEKCGEDNFGNPTYEFRNPDTNTIQVLNSAGHLNYLLNEYAVFGDFCKITYDGTIKIEKGKMAGKDSHTFTLEIDDEKFDKSFARDTSKQSKRKNLEVEKEPAEEISETDLEGMSL